MRIPNIQLPVTIRTLALIPMIAMGACAELELQENVLVPITQPGEVEAYVDDGPLSQELVDPAGKANRVCVTVSCSSGSSVIYCYYPPREPTEAQMCDKIAEFHDRVSPSQSDRTPTRAAEARRR